MRACSAMNCSGTRRSLSRALLEKKKCLGFQVLGLYFSIWHAPISLIAESLEGSKMVLAAQMLVHNKKLSTIAFGMDSGQSQVTPFMLSSGPGCESLVTNSKPTSLEKPEAQLSCKIDHVPTAKPALWAVTGGNVLRQPQGVKNLHDIIQGKVPVAPK